MKTRPAQPVRACGHDGRTVVPQGAGRYSERSNQSSKSAALPRVLGELTVATNEKKERLASIKSALADKYENLARISGSKVKARTFLTRASRYRRQVAELTRG